MRRLLVASSSNDDLQKHVSWTESYLGERMGDIQIPYGYLSSYSKTRRTNSVCWTCRTQTRNSYKIFVAEHCWKIQAGGVRERHWMTISSRGGEGERETRVYC